ncbi:glycosyltransferase [Candidatus Peregrinibacteria bacterium]|jgi:glycosyltransferase involved in cell wall biosynthesis|nr:glycosyltransferase [Candidatus Peregrinibacteria bacterium]
MSKQSEKLRGKKVAIVCDWLTNYAGAERVISAISEIFPEAPIYTSVYNEEKMREFKDREVRQSFIGKLPFAKKKHQLYISLMPYAFEGMNLDEYDIVISSSHACAKGIITSPSTIHVCYCHSPMRYVWDGCHEYVKNYGWYRWPFKFLIDRQLFGLRKWDRLAAERADHFIGNSKYVAERIKKYYGREADVIYPSVDTDEFELSERSGDYYLAVGRLIPYKRFDLLVDTFNSLGLPLYIVGDGKEFATLKERAADNVKLMGFVSEGELKNYYVGAKAFLFPQKEDFGIVPVEAMACGKPVIAYGEGGALETIVDGKTGVLFEEQTVESLSKAVRKFEKMHDDEKFDPKVIRAHAETFSKERFQDELKKYLEELIS